jgi:hypothetical protein
VGRLDEIAGVGVTAAHVILAEIGTDMTRFATAAHLCSWARFAPGVNECAGRSKGRGGTGHGNRYLARVLGKPRWPRARPTPSSVNATGAWAGDEARSGPLVLADSAPPAERFYVLFVAIRSTSSAMTSLIGGRPGRFGYVHFLRTCRVPELGRGM